MRLRSPQGFEALCHSRRSVVTTAQAVAAGVDRTTLVRLVEAGLLESPARGVYVDGGHIGDVIADALRRNAVDLDTLSAQAGTYAAKYGIRGRDGGALLTSLLSQASEWDTYRRNEMATLLSSLDHRQQQISTTTGSCAATTI